MGSIAERVREATEALPNPLEEPGEDEHPVTVIVHGTIAETVSELLTRLAGTGG